MVSPWVACVGRNALWIYVFSQFIHSGLEFPFWSFAPRGTLRFLHLSGNSLELWKPQQNVRGTAGVDFVGCTATEGCHYWWSQLWGMDLLVTNSLCWHWVFTSWQNPVPHQIRFLSPRGLKNSNSKPKQNVFIYKHKGSMKTACL